MVQAPLGRPDPYLIGEIVVLTGNLDMDRLVDAARWVAKNDETARWIVIEDANQTRFAECDLAPFDPEVVDMTGRPAALTSGWRWLSAWLFGPVPTPEQRAWALALIRLSPQRHLLAFRGHPAAGDGYTARRRLWWMETYRALALALTRHQLTMSAWRRSICRS